MPILPVVIRQRFRPGPKVLDGDNNARGRVELVNLVLKPLDFPLVCDDIAVYLVPLDFGDVYGTGRLIAAEKAHPLDLLTLLRIELLVEDDQAPQLGLKVEFLAYSEVSFENPSIRRGNRSLKGCEFTGSLDAFLKRLANIGASGNRFSARIFAFDNLAKPGDLAGKAIFLLQCLRE